MSCSRFLLPSATTAFASKKNGACVTVAADAGADGLDASDSGAGGDAVAGVGAAPVAAVFDDGATAAYPPMQRRASAASWWTRRGRRRCRRAAAVATSQAVGQWHGWARQQRSKVAGSGAARISFGWRSAPARSAAASGSRSADNSRREAGGARPDPRGCCSAQNLARRARNDGEHCAGHREVRNRCSTTSRASVCRIRFSRPAPLPAWRAAAAATVGAAGWRPIGASAAISQARAAIAALRRAPRQTRRYAQWPRLRFAPAVPRNSSADWNRSAGDSTARVRLFRTSPVNRRGAAPVWLIRRCFWTVSAVSAQNGRLPVGDKTGRRRIQIRALSLPCDHLFRGRHHAGVPIRSRRRQVLGAGHARNAEVLIFTRVIGAITFAS